MRKGVSVFCLRFLCGIAVLGFSLYSYLEKQNQCTALSMRLPKMLQEIQALEQENALLHYQIVSFESPERLLKLSQTPQYAHLQFPFCQNILTLKEGLALQVEREEEWMPHVPTLIAAMPKQLENAP